MNRYRSIPTPQGAPLLLALALLLGTLSAPKTVEAFSFDREKQREREEILAEADTTENKWSPGGAFLRSMVVPGWGQAHMEQWEKGRMQFVIELGLLAGGYMIYSYAEAKRDEYVALAQRHAGVREHSRNSDYWVDISKYDNRAEYNEAMLRANRSQDRYLDPADDWDWDSIDHRAHYRNTRALSEDGYSQLLAVGGGILLNHIVSGIHAMKLAGRLNAEALEVTVGEGRVGLALALR